MKNIYILQEDKFFKVRYNLLVKNSRLLTQSDILIYIDRVRLNHRGELKSKKEWVLAKIRESDNFIKYLTIEGDE